VKRAVLFVALAVIAALAITLVTFGAATTASAQGRGAAPPKPRTSRPAAPKKPAKADAGAPPASAAADTPPPPLAGRAEASSASGGAVDAGAVEAKTLDGGARVFRFGEVEIEARLRNPQLVYFLRRVRAEFAAGDLGHRTFMRELSETRKDPSF
jgi:hypothetical protein